MKYNICDPPDEPQARKASKDYFNKDVELYPNPTTGSIMVTAKLTNEKGMLVLINMLGEIIERRHLTSKQISYEFDFGNCPPGALEWRLYDGTELTARGKLVIIK